MIDHFEGLAETHEEAVRILQKKTRQQITHTEDSRSAMGRGMSDVLFRRSENVSILAFRKNDKTLVYKCEYTDSKELPGEKETDFVNQHGKDSFIFEKIEKIIPKSGTYVKFFWKEDVEGEIFPTKDKIKEMMGHYFELKNLLNNKNFTVFLEYVNKDGNKIKEPIRFVQYDFDEIKTMSNRKLDIKIPEHLEKFCKVKGCNHEKSTHVESASTGEKKCNQCTCKEFQKKKYDIKIISATLYKSKTQLNIENDEMRTQGLYIEGEHQQVYTMEFFGLEDKYPIEAPFIFGSVILSKDAKNYMMDNFSLLHKEILSQTRTGFEKGAHNNLYKQLRHELKPWVESALKSESKISMDPTDTSAKKGIEKLNDIMKKISETDDAKGMDTGNGGSPAHIPEFAEFEHKSYQIIKDKPQRIKLLLNPKEFKTGGRIEWVCTDQNLEFVTKIKRIPNKDSEVIKIPIIIKSTITGDIGEIFVNIKSKDGKLLDPLPTTLISCIEEKDKEIFKPHETIEFNPKTVTTKILQSKSIDLYTHGSIVVPGTDIEIWFEPEPNHSRLEPIDIKNPIQVEITSPEYKFRFKVENTEHILKSGNYRKTTITFEGRQPNLKGTIKAKTVIDNNECITKCSVSFISEDDGKKGGYFNQWKAEKVYQNRSWIFESGMAIANINLPHVRSILGNTDNDAKNRFELYEEARLFVANGMANLAFEEAIVNDFEGHDKPMEQQGLSAKDRYTKLMSKKNEWEANWTDEIFKAYEIRPRTQVPDGKIHNHKITVQFQFEFKEFNVQTFFVGDSVVRKIFFPDSPLSNIKRRCDYIFKCMNEKLTIGVYEFENGVAVRFDSFDWNGKMQEILRYLRDDYQVYQKLEKSIGGIPDDWFYSPVEVYLFQKNKLKKIPINLNNVLKIPDSPRSDGGEIPYEDDNTWLIENNKAVLYKFCKDVYSNPTTDKDQLGCFINSKNYHLMALNFFRLRIIRPMATYFYLTETVLPHTKSALCKQCNLKATGQQSIQNSFELFYDNKTPGISKVCIECMNKQTYSVQT